eukprot:2829418-Rhodomonas_salina.2
MSAGAPRQYGPAQAAQSCSAWFHTLLSQCRPSNTTRGTTLSTGDSIENTDIVQPGSTLSCVSTGHGTSRTYPFSYRTSHSTVPHSPASVPDIA